MFFPLSESGIHIAGARNVHLNIVRLHFWTNFGDNRTALGKWRRFSNRRNERKVNHICLRILRTFFSIFIVKIKKSKKIPINFRGNYRSLWMGVLWALTSGSGVAVALLQGSAGPLIGT